MGVDSRQITDLALVVTLVATGLLAGLQADGHPRTWLADRRWMGAAILVNVLLYPIAAAVIASVLGLDAAARTGFIVVATCAGGILGLVVTRIAGADVERAVAAVVVLELLNLATVPLWTTLLLSAAAPVSIPDVLRTLLLMLLAPVAIGWVVGRRRNALVPGLVRILRPTSTVALLVVVAGVLRDNIDPFLAALGGGLPLAGVVLLALGLAAGWIMGGPTPVGRRTLAMVTAGHSTALALAVARSAFSHVEGVEASIAVLGLIGLIVPIGVAMVLRAAGRADVPLVSARG
jgi:BASS family bile acid:Na+ symporter